MKIVLPNNSEYDSQISWEEQDSGCREYFITCMDNPIEIIYDNNNRPLIIKFKDDVSNVLITNTLYYLQSNTVNQNLRTIVTQLTLGILWHENNCDYQICMTDSNLILLLYDHPEFGMHRQQNNILSYKEGSNQYMYVNWFDVGHRELLEAYSAIIINKNEI
jgi:hypothetical protein